MSLLGKSSNRTRGSLLLIATFAMLLPGAASDPKRISIFSRAASYSLPVENTNGQEYAGLLEVLEPLGAVSARGDSKHWKMHFDNADYQFTINDRRVRIKGGDFDLTAPFQLESGRGLVPIASVASLLSRILGGPVSFTPNSRRIFIGNVAVHFTAQVNSSSLVMNFTAPVNPMVATDAGKLRMTFSREPVVPSSTQTLTFNDKVIASANFQDGNGSVDIVVSGNAPLFANFSGDRKTITITPAPSTSARVQSLTPQGGTPALAPLSPTEPVFVVVIDAGHGGDDRGAALSDQISEKEVTLGFALRLRHELEAKGIKAELIRSTDANLSLDQRAATANASHAGIYISLHAASQGNGVRLYTALLPIGGDTHGAFVDWDTAQASSLSHSSEAAAALAKNFADSRISVRTLSAPLRPLNNILSPAVAIEISPPSAGVSGFNAPDYQQLVAATIANGVDGVRQQMGSAR